MRSSTPYRGSICIVNKMSCNYEPGLSIDEWEEMHFGASDGKIEVKESEPRTKHEPVDWDALDDNERRCKNCERYRKEKGYGDFICKHIKGYREAPAHVRRCDNCDKWKKEEGIKGDFWCRHNKCRKDKWDRRRGWEGAAERAQDIREWRQLVRDAR